jgi:hypothetical protein
VLSWVALALLAHLQMKLLVLDPFVGLGCCLPLNQLHSVVDSALAS